MSKLPKTLEVWCCPHKEDYRTTVYLDGGLTSTGELGYVYKRTSNDDEYTLVKSEKEMLAWLNDPENPSEPREDK